MQGRSILTEGKRGKDGKEGRKPLAYVRIMFNCASIDTCDDASNLVAGEKDHAVVTATDGAN